MKFSFAFLVFSLLLTTGCGSDNNSTEVSVTISPTTATLSENQTAQFTATVTNATDTSVTWQVSGVTGGSSSTGTITSTGIFTAPSTIASTTAVAVTAVSVENNTKSASATVTLQAKSTAPTPPITISPSSATLPAGAQQSFTASVGSSSATVVWSVSCNGQTGPACGVISENGLYTAPLFPPPGGGAMITASVTDSTALPGNAPVAIQISNQSLLGTYVFSLSGRDAGNFKASAGTVNFDGQGNVTGGMQDNSGSASTATITGGTYHIGLDGRGVLTLQSSLGTTTYQFVLINSSRVMIESFDTAGGVLSGYLDSQNASELNTASIAGNYSLLFSGASSGTPAGTLLTAGAFAADGAGGISAGLLDINDSGSAQTSLALTGTYSAPSTEGRGTVALSTSAGVQSFIYYIVDAAHLKLLESDGNSQGAAELYRQADGPFSAGSFQGTFVAALGGRNSSGPVSTGGIFTFNGTGSVSGRVDTNNNGNLLNNLTFTGTYAVTDASFGRATMTWNRSDSTTSQFVVYPSSSGEVNILEIDGTAASAIALNQPFSGSFNPTFVGNFAVQASGTDFINNPGPEAFLGRLIPNGGSSITGTLAINASGTLAAGASFQGSYGFDTTGRAVVNGTSTSSTLGTSTFIVYAADSGKAVFIESDSNRVITGTMRRQY